ncbi:MAG TPA: HlyD family efflux transporter periplasmic adaptor subunit [Prolixibacteraceae bacterium]|nr:HlyD family efflux transporter periplasmic adaptor subunit [Prolixibacteraceae bacterium]
MKNKKGLLIAGLILSVLIILFIFFRINGSTLSFTPNNSNYQTSVVDRGEVFMSIEGIGVVEPESEVLLLSPSNSIIKKINKEPGSRVRQGEVIIELDDKPTLAEIEQITDQLEVKSNSLERSRLEGQMARIDLDYNVEVKKLKITSIKAQLADEEQLLSVGGISSAKLDETRQNLVLSEKDLDMVLKKNAIRLKQMKTEESGLNLQIEIQQKQLADKLELLSKMKMKAPSNGIILAIAGKEGEKVGNDKMLISMSDLSSFKIRGSIDEKYSEYIKTGNTVYVFPENEKLAGTIGNITPAVADNKIQFNVHLDTLSKSKLIPNQSVKLQVLMSVKNEVLRISASNDFKNNSKRKVYILDSGKIVSREVTFGMKGSEYQEVISGLNEGENVILSNAPVMLPNKTEEKQQ